MFAVGLVLLNEHPFLVGVKLGTSRHPRWPGMMIPNDIFVLNDFLGIGGFPQPTRRLFGGHMPPVSGNVRWPQMSP